jgi:hypothetical protein
MAPIQTALVAMPTDPTAGAEDVESPGAVVLALYDVISGPAEIQQERVWDRLRSLFVPRATFRLVRWIGHDIIESELREWNVEGFIEAGKAAWRDSGFWEREIWSRTDRFGDIAHVLSTYEGRVGSPDSEPVTRGVNSFQLVRTAGRWWLVSTVWDIEVPGNEIPTELLR